MRAESVRPHDSRTARGASTTDRPGGCGDTVRRLTRRRAPDSFRTETAGLNQMMGSDSDSTSPVTPISERRISTAEPEWAKKKAQGLEARVRL